MTDMTPRQRWMALLAHRPTDRVPTDYQATSEVTARLLRDLDCPTEDALWRKLHVDKRKYVESKWRLPHHPDDPKSLQSYAFGYGYIKALIQAVNSEVRG